jgi:hypothetical protein
VDGGKRGLYFSTVGLGIVMLKTLGIAATLVGAIAASGAFLVAHAAPQPERSAAASTPNFAPKAAPKTFDASCSAAEQADIRPDPKWVGQSYADDGCVAPVLPARVDGYKATHQQVLDSMAAEKAYAAKAIVYQRCIADFVVASRATAEKQNKPLAVAFVVIEDHRIAASTANQQKLKAQVTETIRAYNELGSEDCK